MVSKDKTRALEGGLKAPQTAPGEPVSLGSIAFNAMGNVMNEVAHAEASRYQQEANQVLQQGLDYDEQTKRLEGLRSKYTFGLMTNPGAIIPTQTEQEYRRNLQDNTNSLIEKTVLDEAFKRIETANSLEEWQATRDQLTGTLEHPPSAQYQSHLNAVNTRAKLAFTGDRNRNQAAATGYANRVANNFLDGYPYATPENYEEVFKVLADNLASSQKGIGIISDAMEQMLKRSGSLATVQEVTSKYAELFTPTQVDNIIEEARKREASPREDIYSDKLTESARADHALGLPTGLAPRFFKTAEDRYNEEFLTYNQLSGTAPELIESKPGPPIAQKIAADLRDDLKNDPFAAMQKRKMPVAPTALTLPGADLKGLNNFALGLEQRLKQVYTMKNVQYSVNDTTGTRHIISPFTPAERQVLNATYEASSPENKARLAYTIYRAIEKQNYLVQNPGQMMDAAEALPFKEDDASKMLKLGINDAEFTTAFSRWEDLKSQSKTDANTAVMAYRDSLGAYDPKIYNVYDNYDGLAMYAASTSTQKLFDMIAKNRDTSKDAVGTEGGWWDTDASSGMVFYKTPKSKLIVRRNSPIEKNIKNTNVMLDVMDADNKIVQKSFKLEDLLNSKGEITKDGYYLPLARLKPEHGTSVRRFKIQVTTTIDKANAGIWADYVEGEGLPRYIEG